MQKTYRIHVSGKIFENANTRLLAKRAVEARRVAQLGHCKHCGRTIVDRELASFGFCFGCIEKAVELLAWRSRAGVAH